MSQLRFTRTVLDTTVLICSAGKFDIYVMVRDNDHRQSLHIQAGAVDVTRDFPTAAAHDHNTSVTMEELIQTYQEVMEAQM